MSAAQDAAYEAATLQCIEMAGGLANYRTVTAKSSAPRICTKCTKNDCTHEDSCDMMLKMKYKDWDGNTFWQRCECTKRKGE